MLERKSSALFAKSVFYEDVNDVDVYVEDTAEGYAKIYSIFLSRLLGLSIGAVFPLGTRTKVTERCRDHNKNEGGRKSVFIVDGDLFLICGEKYDIPPDLVVLDSYCIENVLIDEGAFVDILDEEDSRTSAELHDKFAYEEWRADTLPKIRKLFVTYAISFYLNGESTTVARPIKDFAKNDRGELSEEKIDNVCGEILMKLKEKHSEENLNDAFSLIESKLDNSACFIKKYVSAKNYTLPLLTTRARSVVRVPFRNYAIKLKLAKKCNLDNHQALRDRILGVLASRKDELH
jgi:hypothetical protein